LLIFVKELNIFGSINRSVVKSKEGDGVNDKFFFENTGDEQLVDGERLWKDFLHSLDEGQQEAVIRAVCELEYYRHLMDYYEWQAEHRYDQLYATPFGEKIPQEM